MSVCGNGGHKGTPLTGGIAHTQSFGATRRKWPVCTTVVGAINTFAVVVQVLAWHSLTLF